MSIYLDFTAPSGQTYKASIERLSDGFYREDDAETFASGLAFSDKDIVLTEGTSENLGSYTKTLDGSSWSDGLYKFRVHDSTNKTVASTIFSILNGEEVTFGEETPIYHADIQFVRDNSNAVDRYMIQWFKNGGLASVTSPKLNVFNQAGTNLIHDDMTLIGSGVAVYSASSTKRQTLGSIYAVRSSGIIDSAYRTFQWVLARDS